jgi:hypothetical protein
MTAPSLVLPPDKLKKILTIRAKGKWTDKDVTIKYVKELANEYNYIPLAPYTYVQYLMNYLKLEKNPLQTLKDLAFIILNQPKEYIDQLDEKQKNILRLLRWTIHALQLPLTTTGNLLYELAKAVDDYINKGSYKAEEHIATFKERRKKEGFRKTNYREVVLIMDILVSTNFVRQANLDEFIEYIYETSVTSRKTSPKTLTPTFQTKLLLILAPLRESPLIKIADEWARAIVEIGIDTRCMIVKLLKEGGKSLTEIYDQVYEYSSNRLKELIGSDYASKAITFASTALFDDIVLTRMYLMYYKILGGDIVKTLTLFRF